MLIGISGKKQCGKDTICKIIQAIDIYYREDKEISSKGTLVEFVVSCLNSKLLTLDLYRNSRSMWEKHAFADKLKQALAAILEIPVIMFENNTFKDSRSYVTKPDKRGEYYTHRELLQLFGTEVGRGISPDLWVDSLMNKYRESGSSLYWIVTDVRMPNEAAAIKKNGGLLIRVLYDNGYTDNHISETALDDYTDFDYIVDNNGTLEDLINKIIKFYQDYLL